MRSSLVGILANAGLAAVKAVAGVAGNSQALVADAIESTSDIVSNIIVWGGLRIAAAPPDEKHPYGHGKAEPLAAVVVAIALIAAALIIVYQSVHEILRPHEVPASYTLAVLAGVMLIKEGLYRYVHKVGESSGSMAVQSDAWHHRSDAITSLAAFIGIGVALWGGPDYAAADDWAALVAAGFIIVNAMRLMRPALDEIMDAAPSSETVNEVRRVASRVEGVLGLDKCLVRKMGFDFFVDLHVVVRGELTVREGHRIAHAVRDAILRENPRVHEVLVHIEPEEELLRQDRRSPGRAGAAQGGAQAPGRSP